MTGEFGAVYFHTQGLLGELRGRHDDDENELRNGAE